jgi:hypothetical protein
MPMSVSISSAPRGCSPAARLLARRAATTLAAQPFAKGQVGTRQQRLRPAPVQPLDRFAVGVLGGVASSHQRTRAGIDSKCPVGSAVSVGEPLERVRGS